MHIAIDASNIRGGGTAVHLEELLRVANFEAIGVRKVTIWAPKCILERLSDAKALSRHTHRLIEMGGLPAMWFRHHVLDRLIPQGTDLLWVPGGTYTGRFRPYVVMAQNLLPFVKEERNRYRYSFLRLRYGLLPRLQSRTFTKSQGLIHVSKSAKMQIERKVNLSGIRQKVIHHGVHRRFFGQPRDQTEWRDRGDSAPIRILSVSRIERYKHQDKLILAGAKLREKGMPIELDLVGPAETGAWTKFADITQRKDPDHQWITYHGEISYGRMADYYSQADLFVHLSTCESFGMTLLEAMAAGLPILCSDRSSLLEIHGGVCPSANPEDVESIASGLERLIRDPVLRKYCATAAYARAQEFSWQKCADETLLFLRSCLEVENQ